MATNWSESPELSLVGWCVRRSFGLAGPSDLKDQTDQWIKWDAMLALAARHGLIPLVSTALKSSGLQAPDGVQARLRSSYLAAELFSSFSLEPTLRKILTALKDANIEPIVLKGGALAYTVYPNPALRTMSDIDLLLQSDELARASLVLGGLGFKPADDGGEPSHHLQTHYEAGRILGFELHDRLLPEPCPFDLDLGILRTSTKRREIAGVEAKVLAPHDALLFTCLHLAFSHGYRRLPLLRSLADILAISTCSDGDLDWDLFLNTAKGSRASGAVYWPLRMSQDWLRAPIPVFVLSALAPSEVSRRLLGALTDPKYVLVDQTAGSRGGSTLYKLLLKLSLSADWSTVERINGLRGVLFPPLRGRGFREKACYATSLGNPTRVVSGVVAMIRLARRRKRDNTDPEYLNVRQEPADEALAGRQVWRNCRVDLGEERIACLSELGTTVDVIGNHGPN